MGELLVKKIKIEDSQFLEGFGITSQYIVTGASYLIGNMKFFACDFSSALDIFKNVLDILSKHSQGSLAEDLKNRCRNNITIVLEILLFEIHKAWVDHDEAFIDKMEHLFTDCEHYNLNTLNLDRYKAIYLILKKKDFKVSKAFVE